MFSEDDVAPLVLHDEASQAIYQPWFVEIQQQADTQVAHAQIGAKRCFMRRHDGTGGFCFGDHGLIHDDICAEAVTELLPPIHHRHQDLPDERTPAL